MKLGIGNCVLRAATLALAILVAGMAAGSWASAHAASGLRLLMLERPGCVWCQRWDVEVGSVYARTDEGQAAPLMRHRIQAPLPEDVVLQHGTRLTPTFVLLREGVEVGRIEGYPGEQFFYGFLQNLIERAEAPTEEDDQ